MAVSTQLVRLPDVDIHEHLEAAFARAKRARVEARALLDAGFPGPSLVWSVRAAEILIRDFVLAPHFLSEGADWATAMRNGSNVLSSSSWKKAFAKAEEWYGPFDEPLTEDGSNAWRFWMGYIIRRRGDVIHGRPVPEVTVEEAEEVLAFADRMATWFSQRFLTSTRHPIGQRFRELLKTLSSAEAGPDIDQ